MYTTFLLTVEPVRCTTDNNLCRMVAYVAVQLELSLEQVTCDPANGRYQAAISGEPGALGELTTVVMLGFPEARVSLEEIAVIDQVPT